MTTDTTRNASVLREDRKTLMQLLDAAEKDTDAVSVFMAGTTVADTEAAVFVVKGPEHIAYLRAMCERQGMLTADKPVAAPLTSRCRCCSASARDRAPGACRASASIASAPDPEAGA